MSWQRNSAGGSIMMIPKNKTTPSTEEIKEPKGHVVKQDRYPYSHFQTTNFREKLNAQYCAQGYEHFLKVCNGAIFYSSIH